MASNKIPRSYDAIVELLEDAADGAHDHGEAIRVKQNDEDALRANLAELAGTPDRPGLKDKWNTAKGAKPAGTAGLRIATSNGRVLARVAISVLKPRLGDRWNNAWEAAGFTTGSLAVPDNPMTLLQQFASYFGTNPTHEAATLEPIAVTATACRNAADAISTASSASNTSNMNAGQAKSNLEDGIQRARSRLTGLREELNQLLDDDSDLWYSFGFDKPSDPETPEVPVNVVVTPGSPGMMFVDWDDARRAENYRVRVLNPAGEPLAEEIVEESERTFTGLPTGTAVTVVVTARNTEGGESGPSEPASGTVP